MTNRFRHMSIRTRMAFGVLVPLGMATVAVGVAAGANTPTLLPGALMLAAIGTGLVMLQVNARALGLALEEARLATQALARGDYRRRIRIERLDEAGQLLVDLDELGNYLAVMLPDEVPEPPAAKTSTRVRPMPASPVALERIVEQLREGEEDKDEGYGPPMSAGRPALNARPPHLIPDQA